MNKQLGKIVWMAVERSYERHGLAYVPLDRPVLDVVCMKCGEEAVRDGDSNIYECSHCGGRYDAGD